MTKFAQWDIVTAKLADPHRIVACLNACGDMADPATDLAALRGQVAMLRGALEGILNDCEDYINDEDGPGPVQTMQAMREAARAALLQPLPRKTRRPAMNSKTPWTPGPWYYDARWSLIMGPRQQEVAAIHAAQDPKDGRAPIGTAQANARLIAAAPELVEALRAMMHAYDIGQECSSEDCAIAKGRAVMAKFYEGAA